MRPVNLIPPEKRRRDHSRPRTGILPYIVVAVLGAALVTVSLLVVTGNQVKDREAELTELEAREAEAGARAEALRPYAEFASMSEARDVTVSSLAESRFDWERVLRELALVIPDDVWLVEVTGRVSSTAGGESATGVSGGESITGPALSMVGCGASHEAVAGFIGALRDIDGVTRVGISGSERPEPGSATATASAGAGGTDTAASADCRTRDFVTKFEAVAAFDAVSVPAAPDEGATAPVPSEPAATAETQQATDSTAEQTDEAQQAANVVPGVAR
jgi:Tfp pilus assembly protein PilN